MRPLVGTQPQIRWAAEIRTSWAALVGEAALPDVQEAGWWIATRAAPSLKDLLDATAGAGLAYSPFISRYPRHGREAALATLRALDGARYVVVDTETTGVGKRADVIDLALVDADGAPILSTFVRPAQPFTMSPEAQDLHGIDEAQLADAPTLASIWPQVLDGLRGAVLVAFNAQFDVRVLRTSAARAGIAPVPAIDALCAMRLCAAFFDSDLWLSLDEVGHLLSIERASDEVAHRALPDARFTARILKRMIDRAR